MKTKYIIKSGLFLFIVLFAANVFSQTRSAYFMKNTPQRYSINPAMAPERGYFGFPILNDVRVDVNSNSLTLEDVVIPGDGDNNYLFYNAPNFNADKFLKDLKSKNKITGNVGINLINFGFWTNAGFFSLDINAKAYVDMSLSKGLFSFMLDGMQEEGTTHYNFGLRGYANAYMETGFGYSRPINEQWSVGGKLKFYNGIAAADINYENIHAELSQDKWLITSRGGIDVAMKGVSFEKDEESTSEEKPVDGIDGGDFGFVGFGMGVDLGVEYKPLENLTLSFSVNDLGFMTWNKSHTISARSNGNTFEHDGFNLNLNNEEGVPSLEDQFNDMKDDLEALFEPYETESHKMSGGIPTKMHIGGEYDLLNKQLTLGLLSSTYFFKLTTLQEITTNVSYNPEQARWLAIALNYGWVNSGFKTFGWSMSISPNSGVRFFMASDYMIGKVNPQFIPVSARSMNFELGLSFLLGKSKSDMMAFNF